MAELVWKDKARPRTGRCSNEECEQGSGGTMGRWRLVTEECYPPEGTDGGAAGMPGERWHNRLIRGDRSAALAALLPEFGASINLIYIDPPFMTGRSFAKDGQLAYQDTWRNDLDAYLQWLYETLVYLHDLLAVDGSLYIHLDWRTSHYAKIMLDEIFTIGAHMGGAGFKNEIIWHYQSGGSSQRSFARKHDTLLLYTKSARYCFHGERVGERRGASIPMMRTRVWRRAMSGAISATCTSAIPSVLAMQRRSRWPCSNASSWPPRRSEIWSWIAFAAAASCRWPPSDWDAAGLPAIIATWQSRRHAHDFSPKAGGSPLWSSMLKLSSRSFWAT